MPRLTVILYSTIDTKRIIYDNIDDVMKNEIEDTFQKKCQIVHQLAGGALIMKCQKTITALEVLETKYEKATKCHIRKLKAFTSKLNEGDYFYFFNEEKATVVERRTAIGCINAVKAGHLWSALIHNFNFHKYSLYNNFFTYISYGYDGLKESVGEEDKAKRICRFCGRRMPEVTFDKVAHAIQEALGNKLLFCHEECDTCNQNLALTEENFRYLMDYRRAKFHIHRKGSSKAPTVVGKQFIYKADAEGNPQLYLMDEAIPRNVDRTKPFAMHLELKDAINNERMYKALCKMVIDLLPNSELSHFENTIKWIVSHNEWTCEDMPSALYTILSDDLVFSQPQIDIFLNNRIQSPNTPYCTAILWLYDMAYMYIVPFVDVDKGIYKYDSQLKEHWENMRKLTGILQWYKQDTSNYRLSTPWVNDRIDPSLPCIHVLPQADAIFEECRAIRPQDSPTNLPDFKPEGLHSCGMPSTSFAALYHGDISDNDLVDVTLHFSPVRFILYPQEKKIDIVMEADANDTTDKIPYFKFAFKVIFEIDTFEDNIKIEYNEEGNLLSFALHWELRDYLLRESLLESETKMKEQRMGTQFEKCTLEKLLDLGHLYDQVEYYVPDRDGKMYALIKDHEIHCRSYC